MKKILTLIIVLLSVLLIYIGFKDNDIYYLSLGDSLANGITPYGNSDYGYANYVKDYLKDKKKLEVYVDDLVDNFKRTVDISKEITQNIDVLVNGKKKTFQNVLIKADLVTLSIGTNDFLFPMELNTDFSPNDLYMKFDQTLKDMHILFDLLRQYCKEEIILIGYYDATDNVQLKEFYNYVNKKVAILAASYNINYIDLYDKLDNTYFPNIKSSFPNKEGYKVISDEIIAVINKKMLKQ